MGIRLLDFAEPFFTVKYVTMEKEHSIKEKSIILNLSEIPIWINNRPLEFFHSVVVVNTTVVQVNRCLIVEKFADYPDQEELFKQVKRVWPLAYDVTHEERHKGVALWRSPKVKIEDLAVNMCFAGTVPLNVGLHKTHWGGPPIKEVHTQIVGIGKMQQFYKEDLNTLYREEYMAPGCSHIPMFDEKCEYPWHQYETVTPGIFMATELLFKN